MLEDTPGLPTGRTCGSGTACPLPLRDKTCWRPAWWRGCLSPQATVCGSCSMSRVRTPLGGVMWASADAMHVVLRRCAATKMAMRHRFRRHGTQAAMARYVARCMCRSASSWFGRRARPSVGNARRATPSALARVRYRRARRRRRRSRRGCLAPVSDGECRFVSRHRVASQTGMASMLSCWRWSGAFGHQDTYGPRLARVRKRARFAHVACMRVRCLGMDSRRGVSDCETIFGRLSVRRRDMAGC